MRFRPGRLAGVMALLGSIIWTTLRRSSSTSVTPSASPTAATPLSPVTHQQQAPLSRLRATLLGMILTVLAVLVAALPHAASKWTAFAVPGVIGGVLLLLIACIFAWPQAIEPLHSPKELEGIDESKDRVQLNDDRRKLQNDVRAALLQGVAGAALLIGLLFTWQQQQATVRQVNDQLTVVRQGQVGERFSRAIDQLGNDKSVDVRLGGIYELEQLARQADDRSFVIYEILAAYIRRHASAPRSPARSAPEFHAPAPDVQAALTVLGRRQRSREPKLANPPRLDLRNTDLRGVDLRSADLYGANLDGANLRRADLTFAKLSYARLDTAKLNGGHLDGAILHGAILEWASLDGAEMRNADLTHAYLGGAILRGADLRDAVANSETSWPDGFDWKAKGVRRVP